MLHAAKWEWRLTPPVTPAHLEDVIRSEDLASALAIAAAEKKAYDLTILDLQGLVSYTDIFVLCTANNPRQVKAIAESVRQTAKRDFELLPEGFEGMGSAKWVLVDFGDVVVHIFDGPLRGFYNLDGLWSDAPRLPLPKEAAESGPEGQFRP